VDWQHIFVAWGLWWWLLTVLVVIGGFCLVVYERGALFLLSLIVYLGLVQFLGNTPVLDVFQHQWQWVLAAVVGFVAISILWFNWRWHWFTSKMRARYDDVLGQWLDSKGLDALPADNDESEAALVLRIEWQDYFLGKHEQDPIVEGHNHDEFGVIEFRPMFRNHKDAILTWMAAWPLDALAWLFGEVLRDFWNMVYYKFQGFLQATMERNWRVTEGHMPTEAERQAWKQPHLRVSRDAPAERGVTHR
jgi:hypothetical protein